MVNERILANARTDVQRSDGLLRELRLEEERCSWPRQGWRPSAPVFGRSSICATWCSASTFRPSSRTARRSPSKPSQTASRSSKSGNRHLRHRHLLVLVDGKGRRPRRGRSANLTASLPWRKWLAVLEGEKAGMRPCDIAKVARRKWWPDLRPAAVNAAVWKLAGQGRLEKDGRLYKLNGHAGE
jgi:hypothetical protein